MTEMRIKARDFFKGLQEEITHALTLVNRDGFVEDTWNRDRVSGSGDKAGGGGISRVYHGGEFLEKGGVNFSEVFGEYSPEFAQTIPIGSGVEFYATGISLVLHPRNPFVPTVHANFRYLERGSEGWFGGGADLTPCYVFEEDARHFHRTYSEALKPHGSELYAKFKTECDKYFYLPHRGEMRGVGGIFFDYQRSTDPRVFDFVKSCGTSFLKSYMPIVDRRLDIPFSEAQKNFQELRRGRYVEFNLLYDRGTLFGLKTHGRVESILMSLPAKAQWTYNYCPLPGSAEEKLAHYLKPMDWI